MYKVHTLTNFNENPKANSKQAVIYNKLSCIHDHMVSPQVIAQTLQLSMDSFVLELLVRLFEPHTAKTHLAQFCLPSDPEPLPPHYSSHMIRATLDYMPTCYGSSASAISFLRLLSKRNVRCASVYWVLLHKKLTGKDTNISINFKLSPR